MEPRSSPAQRSLKKCVLFCRRTRNISLEFQLHLHPDTLRAKLQEVIDETTPHADRIILGYGLCPMADIGLKAAKSALVMPRVDDCIGLFKIGRCLLLDVLEA